MSEPVYVVDTSVVVDGRILDLVREGEIKGKIIVPKAVLCELEHQANMGLGIGFTGIEVLKELRSLAEVSIEGREPSPAEIAHAKELGSIDRLIRQCARELGAVLITGDVVQHLMAELEGIDSLYLEPKQDEVPEAKLLEFFTPDTMSVHLKEGVCPLAKRGKPGQVRLCKISDKLITRDELKALTDNIHEVVKRSDNAHFELTGKGVEVIQLGEYRIVITKPPFSDGWEITATHPIVHLSIEDYRLSPRLLERFERKAEGIVICGKPGSGKSTFAAALAKFYAGKGKIVKTLENPRDLVVGKEITQYAPLGDLVNIRDVLLLVRPDYTIYDEVRSVDDFKLYADLRMTGVGMVGVVHGNSAIDAIQRFVMQLDVGLLPQVVDTVVFLENGGIRKVYNLGLSVKVPRGMREKDLARPVVEVFDFETGLCEYEIYKFGEETVICPITHTGKKKAELEDKLKRFFSTFAVIEQDGQLVLKVPRKEVRKLRARQLRKLGKLLRKFECELEEV